MEMRLLFHIWLSISVLSLFGGLVLCNSLDLPFVVYRGAAAAVGAPPYMPMYGL